MRKIFLFLFSFTLFSCEELQQLQKEETRPLSALPETSSSGVELCETPENSSEKYCINTRIISSAPNLTSPAQNIRETIANRVELAKRGRSPWPTPTRSYLALYLTNRSNKDLQIALGSDMQKILIDLAGGSLYHVKPNNPYTMEFRVGEIITLKHGDSVNIPIHSLSAGFRNSESFYYLTQETTYRVRIRGVLHVKTNNHLGEIVETKLNFSSNSLDLFHYFTQ